MGTEFSNIESWNIINSFYSRIFGIYNICANRVGSEALLEEHGYSNTEPVHADSTDNVPPQPVYERRIFHFWGGSEIMNPFGHPIVTAPLYKPGEIFGDISKDLLRQKRILLPYLRNDDPYFTHRELHRILYEKAEVTPYLNLKK